jgi:Uma2 family endonuclease
MSAIAVAEKFIGSKVLRLPEPAESMVFRSKMTREQFHGFVLANADMRIERDKFGTITIHPSMTFDSGYYEGEAFRLLANWSKSSKLGRVFSPSTSFDLPDGSEYKADGAWISFEKINQLTTQERKHIASIVPDFVMEVRSETDRIAVLKKKITDVWLSNGVKMAWLIDPIKKQAWVYRIDRSTETYENFDHILTGENLLTGFEFDLNELLM